MGYQHIPAVSPLAIVVSPSLATIGSSVFVSATASVVAGAASVVLAASSAVYRMQRQPPFVILISSHKSSAEHRGAARMQVDAMLSWQDWNGLTGSSGNWVSCSFGSGSLGGLSGRLGGFRGVSWLVVLLASLKKTLDF